MPGGSIIRIMNRRSSRLAGLRPQRLLLYVLVSILLLLVLTVAALRWLPPPTTAFMLQSPVQPVRYHWVPQSAIAPAMRRAVVAAEDQKFWQHHGLDLDAIEKAYVHNQRDGARVRGASTISQQTAKNLFLWSGGGYFRKGLEAGLTLLLELMWDKERILTVYLNVAEFGPGIYGVEAAARHFFNKPASRLTAFEAARLAAVLPSPRRWRADAPGAYVQQRTQWILGQMGRQTGRQTDHRAGDANPRPAAAQTAGSEPALPAEPLQEGFAESGPQIMDDDPESLDPEDLPLPAS